MGPKYIPYTYMDPLGSKANSRGSATQGYVAKNKVLFVNTSKKDYVVPGPILGRNPHMHRTGFYKKN